jgi:hypothetical protein
MTIENNLASIAKSLEIIASVLSTPKTVSVEQVVKKEIVAAPIASQPVPNVQAVVTPSVGVVTAPATTPTVTTLNTTTDTKSTTSAPFADHAALMTFVMDSYKALGPIKGAKIQDVLNSVGVKNINEVKPEHYATIKSGVDALKV